MSRNFSLLFLVIILLSCSKKPTQQEVLEQARTMMANRQAISHTTTYHWENALNEMDTFNYSLQLEKYKNEHFDYNYIAKGHQSDIIYIRGNYSRIDHKDSTISLYTAEDLKTEAHKDEISSIRNTMALAFNPILLLQLDQWSYLKDTTVKGALYHDYFLVKMDTVIDGKEIYLENHLFINPATKNPDFFSNRLYHNGSRSQLINAYFSDYDFHAPDEKLDYLPPANYLSRSGKNKNTEKRIMLKAGDKAPGFELPTLEGKTFTLSDMRGKKVLLDFSMINCGWCAIALEQFTKPEFSFRSNINPIYINPVDSKEDVKKYQSLNNIPFPIIPDAGEIGKAYGVSGYPSFFLIDENGYIEKAFAGYDKSILLGLGQ
ncbi:peroxiredoxin family protein [Echinicola rosea]|uniref:Thioredoxin domain-containing protein n=1 Tax=Echinicola rosea TaxID=1807691 RepID=A0ABQ1V6N4_9BACT|nr:peroxiredoxin family protein [Echinicola rosea]GGF40122.1 hypothetical protein GCM10011339_30820 [Echinicola rosea]